jgi:phage head maturation protease
MRDVSEVSRLWDVSPVTFAAYPQTDAALRSMRSLEAADRQQIAEREAAERSGAAQAAATEEQEKRLRRARLALAASS